MRARTALAAIVAVALLALPGVARASGPAPKTPLAVVIVAGQSNALGYQSYVVNQRTHENVFKDSSRSPADTKVLLMWTESGVPGSGPVPVRLDSPQDLTGAPSPIFGPEVGLARGLYAAGHHHLLVVKVAFSGSSLAVDWQPGQSDYESLLDRVGQAMAWAQASGYVPSIAGFYWMQGETDAMSAAGAGAYKANLLQFFRNVRAALALSPKTPFAIGQIDLTDYIDFEQTHGDCATPSCASEKQWNKTVMDAQAACASRYVFVTPTKTLSRVEHFLHLSDTAELKLGKAFATLTEHHLT